MNSVFVPENMKLTSTNFANGPNVILEHSRVFVPMLATGIMA